MGGYQDSSKRKLARLDSILRIPLSLVILSFFASPFYRELSCLLNEIDYLEPLLSIE